jgi:acyl-CoA synthetase (AMP-forming)/AMP-acid ligase II
MTAAPKPRLVCDGVLLNAIRAPDRPAIAAGGRVITYGELAWRICRVASAVDAVQARRVAVSLPNHPALLEIFFGTLLAGAVFMVFEPRWPRETLLAMLAAHQPQLLFAEDEPASVKLSHYAAWRDRQDADRVLRARPTPDMPFLIGFTSGTTGTPKAFIRDHASWMASFAASRAEFGTSEDTRVLLPGPLSHGLSLYAAAETLNAGGCVTIDPVFDAAGMMRLASSGAVNAVTAAPTVLDLMLDHAAAPVVAITAVVTAGAKLSARLREKLARAFPWARLIEYYGASELSFVTVAKSDENCPGGSVGRAFAGVQIKTDADNVIWVKSDMLSSGYVGPADGAGFRLKDGWATVGDRGTIDARGFLTLWGREGDMIISGGLNVYPSEVEAVLGAVPGVREVSVTGEPDERWGQIVTATVAGDAPLAALKAACARHLPAAKHPRRWFWVDAFAHTASGKIDRTAALDRRVLS